MTTVSWERLCSTSEVVEGEVAEITTSAGTEVIALRTETGSVKVFQKLCPHQKRSLADGYLDENILTCAAHMWQFDINTGEGINAARCGIASYPVRVEDGYVFIDASEVEPLTLWT